MDLLEKGSQAQSQLFLVLMFVYVFMSQMLIQASGVGARFTFPFKNIQRWNQFELQEELFVLLLMNNLNYKEMWP